MKQLLLLIGILISQNIYAKKILGSITFNNGKTEKVTLLIVTGLGKIAPENTYKIKYIDKKGKSQKAKPDSVLEYSFEFKGDKIKMISVPFFLGKGKRFLKLIVDGKLQLLSYSGGTNNVDNGFWLFDGTKVFRAVKYYQKGLKTKGKLNFEECPELKKEIDKKKLERNNKDIIKIVSLYNELCE